MATYRKPLKDIDGNFIIPAMTGDQTGWVQNGDLADGAATGAAIEHWEGNNVDLNNFTTSGIYRFYTPISNGPTGQYQYCSMLVTMYGSDYRCTQYFTGIDDSGVGVTAVRFSYHDNGARAWSSWKILAQWP